jgi:hypothetical protein
MSVPKAARGVLALGFSALTAFPVLSASLMLHDHFVGERIGLRGLVYEQRWLVGTLLRDYLAALPWMALGSTGVVILHIALDRAFGPFRSGWVPALSAIAAGLAGFWLNGGWSTSTLALAAAGALVGLPLMLSVSFLRVDPRRSG